MSTTVTYKGETLATVNNNTKVLTTEGKYLEDDITLVDVTGGGSATLGEKTVNANGVYNASSDSLDGYSKVTVAVPASAVDTGTKSITANGNNQDVVGYAAVNVNVPNSYSAGDEGKVVSSGALVSQTAHADVTPTTSDQTIDTTLNNSLKVKGDANLVAGNIKKDVVIFNTTGTYEGSGGGSIPIESGTVTPSSDVGSVSISVSFDPVYFAIFANPAEAAIDSGWRVVSEEMLIKGVLTTGLMGRINNNAVQLSSANAPSFSWSNGIMAISFGGRNITSGVTYTWYAIGGTT